MLRTITILMVLAYALRTSAQFYNWGWAPEISVNQNGSTITCTVWDPVLNMSRTYNQSSVASWSHDDGVAAAVSGGGVLTAIVYDQNLASFRTKQLTSTSGTSVINIDGVIAWVSGSGSVGAAIYDPDIQAWVDEQFSSSSGNQIQNRDGVVSWVSGSGIVGAAVYDPGVGHWQDQQFGSSSGNVVQNRDGVVGYVSASGILGAAIYDPSIGQWVSEQFSSSSGNAMVMGQGVVAWKSSGGILGGAAYNWTTNTWDDAQFSSSSSNTMPTITDGTIQWNNSSGQQRYGYTASNQWQSNANTSVRCEYHAEQVSSAGAPHIAYLWCLSIGASSYTHGCGDGHTITRRWAWKQYAAPGSYTPQFTAFSSTSNTQCNGHLSFIGTAVRENEDPTLRISWTGTHIRVVAEERIGGVEVFNGSGRLVVTGHSGDHRTEIPADLPSGMYIVRAGDRPARRLAVVR